jgi:hypothetical protein
VFGLATGYLSRTFRNNEEIAYVTSMGSSQVFLSINVPMRFHPNRNLKIEKQFFCVSIQDGFHEAPKGWRFENLGNQGWLLRASGWIHAFLETAALWGERW